MVLHQKLTKMTNISHTLTSARSAGPLSVTLDMNMPSSSPLNGVEPLPPAIDRPRPADVRSMRISYCSSLTSIFVSKSEILHYSQWQFQKIMPTCVSIISFMLKWISVTVCVCVWGYEETKLPDTSSVSHAPSACHKSLGFQTECFLAR